MKKEFEGKCKVLDIPFENEYGFFVQPISGNDTNILFANAYGQTKKIAESNAKLIAAAPEMLEMLQILLNDISGKIPNSPARESRIEQVEQLLNKILD